MDTVWSIARKHFRRIGNAQAHGPINGRCAAGMAFSLALIKSEKPVESKSPSDDGSGL
jgi:hypothetical protein